MRCQCNKIRLDAGMVGEWVRTIGQALASVGAPHSACPFWHSRPADQIPGIACRMFNTRGQKATNRIDALPQRFPLFAGSLAHGSATAAMQLQQRMTAQLLLMKVPSRSSPGACRSSACVFITIGPYWATGFSRRFSRDEQKLDSFFAGLDCYLVATVEENERATKALRLNWKVLRNSGRKQTSVNAARPLATPPKVAALIEKRARCLEAGDFAWGLAARSARHAIHGGFNDSGPLDARLWTQAQASQSYLGARARYHPRARTRTRKIVTSMRFISATRSSLQREIMMPR